MLATPLIKLLMLALFGLVARWGYSNDGRSYGRASAAFALVILLAIMLLGKTL
jgi:nitrate reductase gamma subunit